MPYRKVKFKNGDIVHVILRGIDSNLIFKDIDDYYRGIFSIYEFNNLNPVSITKRREIRRTLKKKIRQIRQDPILTDLASSVEFKDERDKLIDVLCFCFMPNHVHILIKQVKDNGITKFMRKFGIGYASYLNRKYKRKGYVFQNRFNAIHIKTDEQLRVVFAYIHTNPVSLIYKDWKKIRVKEEDFDKIIKFLENYKWSSYLDYMEIKNFPSVTQRDFILETIGDLKEREDFLKNWIRYKGELKEYAELFLE